MHNNVDFAKLVPPDKISGEDEAETSQLKSLHEKSVEFISGFSWCRGIRQSYFAAGAADIIGIFLFEIAAASSEADAFLWVIVGDLPPAYLVTDDATDAASALEGYIKEMERWVNAVNRNTSLEGIIPVNGAPTAANAEMLNKRLTFLIEKVLPILKLSA